MRHVMALSICTNVLQLQNACASGAELYYVSSSSDDVVYGLVSSETDYNIDAEYRACDRCLGEGVEKELD